MAQRLQKMGSPGYENGFKVTLKPERLEVPFHWKRPRKIFVCSMGDLFHEQVPDEFLVRVFDVMRRAYWHTFQVLTKRPKRMADWSKSRHFNNVWVGTTVENDRYLYRLDDLRRVNPGGLRFVSFEPLLDSIGKFDLTGIGWVIVGSESGPRARYMDPNWAREIRDQCADNHIPFFMKQMHDEYRNKLDFCMFPEDLRIREFPR
jgi:protein gp37